MKDRRIISFVLALVMSFNFSISAFAENAEGTESMSGLQKHTVTITAGEKTGKLMPLTSAGTTLNDRGDYLQNAEGVVETQVQSVYYPNQKLVSVELAGTGFSFSPLMLDVYDPQIVETISPESSETPVPSSSPEAEDEPGESENPESSAVPDAETVPEAAMLTETSGEPETSCTPAPDASSEINETPESKKETQSGPSVESDVTEDPIPTEDVPTASQETVGEPVISTGYGKTIRSGKIYETHDGEKTLGTLKAGVFLYIISVSGLQRAEVVLNTPAGLIWGYVSTKDLQNLTEDEQQQAAALAESQTDKVEYNGILLLRTDGYTPDQQEPENTDVPEITEQPAALPTEVPSEAPVIPEETPDAVPTAALTDDPAVPQPTASFPSPSDDPAPADTPAQTEKPSETETENEQELQTPENTGAPDITQQPVLLPTETPAEVPVIPEETPIAASTAAPTEVPTTAPQQTAELQQTATDSAPAAVQIPTDAPAQTEIPTGSGTEKEQDQQLSEEAAAQETESSAEQQSGETSSSGFVPSLFHALIPGASAESRPGSIPGIRQYVSGETGAKRLRSTGGQICGMTYPGLFDAVTDVHLSVSTTGVKEDIRVHQYTGNHVYAYRLTTEGLTAVQSGQEIHLTCQGQMLAKLEAPYMKDANGASSTDITVVLEGSGSSYVVTYLPNDDWMRNAAYPVTIDPSGSYYNDLATNIGDVYVTAGNPNKHFDHTVPQGSAQHQYEREGNNLYAGTYDGGSIAYILPSLVGFHASGASAFPEASGLLISEAKWNFRVRDMGGDGSFRLSLVTGDWNTSTVTYNNRPGLSSSVFADVKLHKGWNEVDVTRLFSAWFNAMDQKRNYGIAITSSTSWANIQSSDILPRSERMNFSASYYTGVAAPSVQASAGGYGVNSQSGWVDLSWNAVPGASGYLLGIYNGKTYEYHSLGNVRSFTTRGKKLWPTDAETAAGSFALHWDGSGQELPNIPRKGVSDLNYYFRVLPANACGQVADSSTAGTAGIILPDTTPPSQPATLSVSPASWSNAETRTVTWAGVTDMPSGSSSLGAGHIQYVLNPEGTDQAAWEWQNTDSNTANGSFELSVIGLEDGIHALYVRGIDANGNYGLAKGVEIPVDRTPPSAPATVTILPDDWTKENEAVLTWTSVSDTNDLLRVEYAVDTGAFTDTGLKDQSYTGFVFDISSLADGEHTVAVRGVDIAGNTGAAQTVPLRIDRSAPTLTASALDSVSWTDADSVNLTWEGAGDAYSGLAGMSYQVDDGTAVPLTAAENGQQTIDISNLADGTHTVALTLADALDNVKTVHHTLFIDRTAPETELTAPQNGDVVTGVLEVWGTVKDRSLSDWTVTAKGSSGKTVTVVSDMEEKDAQQLGVLDTGMFADGETIEVVLTAHDLSGHESTVKGIFLKADHSARPVQADVTITAPSQGEVIAAAHKEAAYTTGYTGAEAENRVISDGQPAGRAAGMKYNLYPILCPENSVHSLSVLSKAADGTMHYSQGMASMLVISDLFAEAGRIEAQNGVALSAKGAEAVEETGTITSKTFTVSRPMLAIRLHTVCQPAGRVSCEYSTDHGASWHPLEEGKDAWFDAPQTQVAVRAALSGAGTILQGLDITGVYEINPVRWKAQLLRPVTAFDTTGGEFTQAKPEIKNNAQADLTVRRQYMDGVLQSDSFTASFLPYADGSVHQIAQIGLDARGTLHGSGAETVLLLRNTPNAGGICETGLLSLKGDTYALRLETLCVDASSQPVTTGKYAYSFDGNVWTDMELNQYVLLPRATNQISVRAELPDGVTLRAMHLEGVVLKSTAVSATLIKAPYNVQAADYGDYYENEKLRRYVLTWSDPNRDDGTAGCKIVFDIYRNGSLVATTEEKRFEDFAYEKDTEYQVRARRVYDDPQDGNANILTRASRRVKAAGVHIPKEQRIEGVQHHVENFKQSEYLNDLYGGNYTFSTASNPPNHSFALNQALLGPHRFCSLGFEPLNFNTGNFFLQALDANLPDLGDSALSIVRTYNSQSNETDGPFGAKWGTAYSQHLRLFADGSVAYRRADGSEIIFYRQPDGGFTSNTTEYEQLSYNDAQTEYLVTLTDGTVYAFQSGGLLARVEENDGQHITQILRDEDGLITKIISPAQEELLVQMDKAGHITKLTLPGGAKIQYQYKGKNLVAVTDPNGAVTKYQYDAQGRMTAWWDGNGTKQVQNRYDKENRVVAQTDANGGQYRLAYYADHTVTTDAEGNTVSYYFDEWKRTTRIVDAMGGETLYTYGEQGEIVSKTDSLGRVTTYAYNVNGDKIREVDPRGMAVTFVWDENHHLLSRQDQNGNETSYTYDEQGNLLTETAPDGGVTAYTYDEKGRKISATDALGHTTRYEYVNGLLTKITDPMGYVTVNAYDANGHLSSQTNALGETTAYEHDSKGNLLKLTFADGASVSYTYDALGHKTSMTDPKGNITKYAYDGLGQLIKSTLPDRTVQSRTYTKNGQIKTETDALGNRTAYAYDRNGNRVSVTDPMGHATLSEYDAAGQLTKETNALGGVTAYTYDAVGLPLTVTDPNGLTQAMTYDGTGNLLTRTLPNGAVIATEYDSMNRPVRQINAMGGVTEISYDPLGRILSVTDPMGAKTAYTYDANGNLLTSTNALGATTAYAYDALNRMISQTAPNGGVTKYAYDSVGNLASVTDALGYTTAYAYDANGSLSGLTDPLGHTVSMTYDANGRAIAAIQKNGGVLATAYDKAGRIASETDANGHTTRYSYNKNGLVSKVTDALNQQAAFEYDALGNISKITAPGKAVTLYTYDSAGRATGMTDPVGCETVYAYNEAGQLISRTLNGNVSTYEYDAAGNLSAVTDAEGRRIAFTYDLNGRMMEIVYPDGSRDTTEYDALGRTVRTVPRTGLATAYAYDAMGNILSVTQGEHVTRYEYDLLGRRVKQITADGAETAYAYDALGNLIGTTDPLGSETAFIYSAESLLEKVIYANGASQSLTYDLVGNVTAETDAEGHTKQYLYDRVNRLTGVIDQLGNKTTYAYDPLDNISRVTDALQHVTSYTYDKQGNLLTERDALGNMVKYVYTPEGWLQKVIKADGKEISYKYDKTGNLLTQYAGDGQTIQSGYNDLGMVTTVSSEEGTIRYQYNAQGCLISVTNVNGDVVSYRYDQYGNKTGMTYPDGRKVSYTYDAMNRMASATGLDGEKTTYAYDKAGRRIKTQTGDPTSASSLTTEYSYDSVGNMLEQATSGASSIAFLYSYNRNGYITGEKRTEDGKTTESMYTYDPLGQLTGFTMSTGYEERYIYDAAGNMLQKVITGETDNNAADSASPTNVTLKMQYNKANQLISMANGVDEISYSYDRNGSMVKKVLNSRKYDKLTDIYTYNALDQLTAYTGYDGYRQQLTYDANGMRLSKKEMGNGNRSTLEELLRGNIPGLPEIVEPSKSQTNKRDDILPEEPEWATTEYLYDLTQEYYQVIQEKKTSKSGTSKTAYAYGLERIAAYDVDGTGITGKTNYVYDGRGSVAQTVSVPVAGQKAKSALPETQIKVQSFSYTAFGEQMGRKISGFGYNAEDFDAATGMINLRARQYEPTLSRFSQKDIVRGQVISPQSLNRHAYCVNSPMMHIDPSGMKLNIMAAAKRALTGTVSTIIRSVKNTLTSVKQSIKALASAANKGYIASNGSNDINIRAAYYRATLDIKAREKAEKRTLSDKEKDKIFVSECMLISMQLAEMYGANTAKEFTSTETIGVYSSMIAMNPKSTKSERATANQLLMDNGFSKAPFDKKMVCVPYVCNAYQNSALFKVLEKLPRYNKIIRKTTPLYAALACGESREYGNITGSDLPSEYVKAVISLGNTTESPKIKLAGDSEYIDLYDSSIVSFTTKEQADILLKAKITQPLDIMFFGKESYTKDGKTIKSTNPNYNPDVNQIHAVLLDSASTYSGMGAESGNGDSNVQKNKEINADSKFGIDVILMNHNALNIQSVMNRLGGR